MSAVSGHWPCIRLRRHTSEPGRGEATSPAGGSPKPGVALLGRAGQRWAVRASILLTKEPRASDRARAGFCRAGNSCSCPAPPRTLVPCSCPHLCPARLLPGAQELLRPPARVSVARTQGADLGDTAPPGLGIMRSRVNWAKESVLCHVRLIEGSEKPQERPAGEYSRHGVQRRGSGLWVGTG